MKRLFAILIALMMVLSLAACDLGGNGDNPGNTDNPGTSQGGEENPGTQGGENNPGSNTDNPGNEQTKQTIDEYVAALSEYVKSRHSNALIYYDDTYMLGDWGYPVLVACEQSESDENACIAYLYMGHFNQDTAYNRSKTADSVGPNGDVNASKVIEWNDELKCYSYLYGNNSWANMESTASGRTIIQERSN